MTSLKSIKKLTLKALLAFVSGTTLLASGTACDSSSEYQASMMAHTMSPGIAKLISNYQEPTHIDVVWGGLPVADGALDARPGGLQAADVTTK